MPRWVFFLYFIKNNHLFNMLFALNKQKICRHGASSFSHHVISINCCTWLLFKKNCGIKIMIIHLFFHSRLFHHIICFLHARLNHVFRDLLNKMRFFLLFLPFVYNKRKWRNFFCRYYMYALIRNSFMSNFVAFALVLYHQRVFFDKFTFVGLRCREVVDLLEDFYAVYVHVPSFWNFLWFFKDFSEFCTIALRVATLVPSKVSGVDKPQDTRLILLNIVTH